MQKLKNILITTSSLSFSILGILISMVYFNGKSIGEHLFKNLIPDGVLSITLFFISIYLNTKIKNQYSSIGSFISKVFLILIILGAFITLICEF